jgi:transcriptional accessory protein Tex/SPT6
VLIVAVLIVAVLADRVPIVTVPVVADTLELKVAAAVTPRLEDKVQAAVTSKLENSVTAPVTARLDDRVVAPAALSVPVDLTPAVDNSSALAVLSPSVIACNVPSIPPKPSVFRSCG